MITVFPDPAQAADRITLKTSLDGDASIELLDTRGSLIRTWPTRSLKNGERSAIDLPSAIAPGLYTIRVISADHAFTARIIIAR
jgi:hypothetical protein